VSQNGDISFTFYNLDGYSGKVWVAASEPSGVTLWARTAVTAAPVFNSFYTSQPFCDGEVGALAYGFEPGTSVLLKLITSKGVELSQTTLPVQGGQIYTGLTCRLTITSDRRGWRPSSHRTTRPGSPPRARSFSSCNSAKRGDELTRT
jgi:hypothetical protein